MSTVQNNTIDDTAPPAVPLTALGICNLALSKLGESPLEAIDANGSPASRMCYMHYHPVRREVLMAHRWSFATRLAQLDCSDEGVDGSGAASQTDLEASGESSSGTPESVNPPTGALLPHSLPQDCLRVLEVNRHNWVLRGAARRFADLYGNAAPVRIVTSSIEHHAVLRSCEQLEAEGVEVTYLPVDAQGHVSPRDLEAALAAQEEDNRAAGIDAPGCALVSVMLANNEIGTIEDVPALASVAHAHGAPFHTDAVQAVGHIPVNVDDLGVDALSLSAHKFHGPRGCGALYLREGFSVPALIAGGAQERGERAGTENLAGIVGTAAALELMCDRLDEKRNRTARLRDQVIQAVASAVPGVHLTGDPLRRLPSIASFTCENVDGELLVVILDQLGVAAATGSACSTGSTDPSHVLAACGIPGSEAKGALRLSIADDLTENDAALLGSRTAEAIRRARSLSALR